MSKNGALPPPGRFAKQEKLAKEISLEAGYVSYCLIAGYGHHGMAVCVKFQDELFAKTAHHARGGTGQKDQNGRYHTLVDGIEVFFDYDKN